MSVTPVVLPEPEPKISNMAQDEAAKIADRELQRGDSKRTHLHYGGLLVFWVSIAILLAMIGVWAWQIITPDRLHFLSADGNDRLQTILVSILGSSFVSSAARRWIGDSTDESESR